jgi:hypothetical protein
VGIGVVPSAWNLGKAVELNNVGSAVWATGVSDLNFLSNAYYNSGFKYAGSSLAAGRYQINSGIHYWYNAPSGTAGNAITFTQAMTLDTSGNLLVGTTSSALSSRMEVVNTSGNPVALFRKNNTNTGPALYVWHGGATGAATATQIDFLRADSSSVGSITSTVSATAYVTSSDYRLKNTIAPMTGALAKVSALKPVTYKWNIDGSDGEGFIAHELQEVCPDAVIGEKDAVDAKGKPVYQGIDTSFLVATLTAAIKEQQALITTLTDRITALENK